MSFGKHFKNNDFTLYEENGDIFSLHMKFNNFFRNQNLPAMVGGGKKNHLNINNGLSVPLGLALLNKQGDTSGYQDIHNRNREGRNLDGGVLKEDIYSKLLSLADSRNQKKSNRKTKKMTFLKKRSPKNNNFLKKINKKSKGIKTNKKKEIKKLNKRSNRKTRKI
jgi:hypothetical protein